MRKQNHIFNELAVILSQERLDSYLSHAHCQHNNNEALIAYAWNMELSQALYPSLQILEIALRNAIHDALTQNCKTEYWFDLPFLCNKEQVQIINAKENLRKDKKPIEAGRLVAELSFGFWTSLFDVRYEHDQILWPRLLKATFPWLPKRHRTRTYLCRELNRIRLLRNRIFHYEPIWHWKNLLEQHKSILFLINGLSQMAAHYLTALDRFPEMYAHGKSDLINKLDTFTKSPSY